MRAEKALLDAYGEWRRLARAGSKAIRLRNWPLLTECQNVIQKLQPRITRLTHEARNEWRQVKQGVRDEADDEPIAEPFQLLPRSRLLAGVMAQSEHGGAG